MDSFRKRLRSAVNVKKELQGRFKSVCSFIELDVQPNEYLGGETISVAFKSLTFDTFTLPFIRLAKDFHVSSSAVSPNQLYVILYF